MAFTDTISLRSQLRTNIPDDTRIVGTVAAVTGTPSVSGRGFTFLNSGATGNYYILFGNNVTATFNGAGDLVTVSGASTMRRLLGWNLEPLLTDPVANFRTLFATGVVAPGGSIFSQNIGLRIKCLNGTPALANFGSALDGFAFEICCSSTEVAV